jgi:hypothetical protein
MQTGMFGGALVNRDVAIKAGFSFVFITSIQPGDIAVKLPVKGMLFRCFFRRPAYFTQNHHPENC